MKQRKRKSISLLESCKNYNPRPIIGMTDAEAREFSIRQAIEAKKLIRLRDAGGTRQMDDTETALFASAILDAIHYFNARETEHKRRLAYREECRRREECKRLLRHENILMSIM